jgi:hypothetical protein
MARIATECPRCGRVELGVDEVAVVVDLPARTAWYLFDCGGCARPVFKTASPPVVAALAKLGVPVRAVPVEVLERGDPDDGPAALRVDDVLDTILWLRTHDYLDPGLPSTADRAVRG